MRKVSVHAVLAMATILWTLGQSPARQASVPEDELRLFDVGDGLRLAIHCEGEGSPSVVIEPGAGDPGDTWIDVQRRVADHTRVCWYSRAGLGASDEPRSETLDDVVTRLHALLDRAEVEPPHVLVGHSLGGLHVRFYQHAHPGDVVGLVLVDPSHEDQWRILEGFIPAPLERFYQSLPVRLRPGRGRNLTAYAAPLTEVEPPRDLPVAVLSAGDDPPLLLPPDAFPERYRDEAERLQPQASRLARGWGRLWRHLHGDLARMSTNGTHEVVERAGHFVHVDAPGVVAETILSVVAAAREKDP